VQTVHLVEGVQDCMGVVVMVLGSFSVWPINSTDVMMCSDNVEWMPTSSRSAGRACMRECRESNALFVQREKMQLCHLKGHASLISTAGFVVLATKSMDMCSTCW
jgi:hypothetical protein